VLTTKPPTASELRRLYSLKDTELDAVRSLGAVVQAHLPSMIDEFYRWLVQQPDYHAFFNRPGLLEHIKQQQLNYWHNFFAAEISEEYIETRRRVGRAHAAIGLPVQPYIASINHFIRLFLLPLAQGDQFTPEKRAEITAALDSLARFDTGITMNAVFRYHAECFHEMADGDFTRAHHPRSENDLFGHALARMAARLQEVESVCGAIGMGSLHRELAETGDRDHLARAINSMVRTLRSVNELATVIASGDYSGEIEPRSEDDQLGLALKAMTESLRSLTAERERQLWFAHTRTHLAQAMRGNPTLPELAHSVLLFLSQFLDAPVATCYICEGTRLTLAASLATGSVAPQTLQLGEGLLGASAQEGKPRLLVNLPTNYLQIGSSLGASAPPSVLMFPFLRGEKVVAIAEFASLGAPSNNTLEFLDQAGPDIALALLSAQTRKHVTDLLSETQIQAQLLQSSNLELEEHAKALKESEERLRAQQEELEAFNEELEEKNQLLSQQTRSLEQGHSEIQQQARKLEMASQYKSEFLANMSHELRTPLNSMLILAKLLTENESGNLSADQIESARVIHASGTDLLNIISDVLDLAKIEAGRMDVVTEEASLTDLGRRIEQQFRPMAAEKHLDFSFTYATGLPGTLKTDPVKLAQIMRNLLANAFKFTPKGNVRVEIRPLDAIFDSSVYPRYGATGIAIAVSDTGIGIPPDKLQLIFEAFRQADGTTSRSYGGTGLGLSISKEYASILGGEITVRSEPGVGSTFTLYLGRPAVESGPVVTAPPTEAPQAAALTAPPPPMLIDDRANLNDGDHVVLIIEDDSYFARILCDMAHRRNFRCLHADDGLTGLKMAQHYRPHAILLDVMLPSMDGWSVLDRLKEDPATRHIPVQLISAHDDLYNATAQGAIGFLRKPVSKEELDQVFARTEALHHRTISKLLLLTVGDSSASELAVHLAGNGVEITRASSIENAAAALKAAPQDCVVIEVGARGQPLDLLALLAGNTDSPPPPVLIYTTRELSPAEDELIRRFADRLTIKNVRNVERLLNEATLFLHIDMATLTSEQSRLINPGHDYEAMLRGKTALLVDDDMRNTFALSKVLRGKGMNILMADNGQRALELLQNKPAQRIDVILMDIMMPVMDGYETIGAIRADQKFTKLPIIALTAKAMPEDRRKCLAAGASDYLAKPVDATRLLSMLRVWLQQ